jgi:hypothetical protein
MMKNIIITLILIALIVSLGLHAKKYHEEFLGNYSIGIRNQLVEEVYLHTVLGGLKLTRKNGEEFVIVSQEYLQTLPAANADDVEQ